jgi:hypothetical protein
LDQSKTLAIFGPLQDGGFQVSAANDSLALECFPGEDLQSAIDHLKGLLGQCPGICVDWDLRGPGEQEAHLDALRRAGRRLLDELASGGDGEEFLARLPNATLLIARTGRHIPWEFLYHGSLEGPVDIQQFVGAHAVVGRPYDSQRRGGATGGASVTKQSDFNRRRPSSRQPFGIAEDHRLHSADVGSERGVFSTLGLGIKVLGPLAVGIPGLEKLKEFVETSNVLTHFNSHAEDFLDKDGVRHAAIFVTDCFRIDLNNIQDLPMCEQSIVFLNCCKGMTLSFAKQKHVAGEFASRRVSAVIATTGEIPDAYATAWARAFYRSLGAGHSIADSILQARQEMLKQDRNPMALLYAFIGQHDASLAEVAA